ncbi:MAG: AraC family transcriptional regulator, partial [Mesorhizobium sp.]
MSAQSEDGSNQQSPGLDRFEMVRRAPGPWLQGSVTDICGYRETMPGRFRNVEYASLTVPLVIS